MTDTRAVLENWRSIPGFEGLYEVSSLGAVRSLYCRPSRLISTPIYPTSRGLKYRRCNLRRGGKQRFTAVHRVVAMAFHGPPPEDGYQARHLNGDSLDNRADNIAWGTRSENALDAVRHGTHTWASRTHCPQGHPYSGENLIRTRRRRDCRSCRNAKDRAYRARIKSASTTLAEGGTHE